ncbi:MAG: hypothetical protein ACRC1M_07320 [Methanobacteriaceae archaeon]
MKISKIILLIVLVVFVSVMAVNAADTVSATKYKVIDKGTMKFDKLNTGDWKTYYNGKNVKTSLKTYIKTKPKSKNILLLTENIYYTKVSKTKLKITWNIPKTKYSQAMTQVHYVKTKLNTKSFYFKYVKPGLNSSGHGIAYNN